MAKLVRHLTSNEEIVSSNLAEGIFFLSCKRIFQAISLGPVDVLVCKCCSSPDQAKVPGLSIVMTKEDDELKEIWSLFSSEDSSVNEKRKKIHSQYQNQTLSSFPDHLSITTAFDEVLQCFSLGGQVKHYYRYGSYSLCKSQREKFWFSVTNGTFSQDKKAPDFTQADMERRQKIQEYYKKKLLEQKAAGSSEDVWDARTELLDRPFEENRG